MRQAAPQHLHHILPAALNLFDTIGYDVKIVGDFRTSNLPVLFSSSYIAGPFIDTFAATLTAQLHALNIPKCDIYIGSTQVMDWMRYPDAEWDNFEQSKRLKAVRFSSITHDLVVTSPFRLENSSLVSRTAISESSSYPASLLTSSTGRST
jgi:hypothetical protein